MEEKPHHPPPVYPMYAVAMQQAVVSGDLQQMKTVAQQAEEQLKQSGDLSASLEVLKIEIAKLEQKHKSKT